MQGLLQRELGRKARRIEREAGFEGATANTECTTRARVDEASARGRCAAGGERSRMQRLAGDGARTGRRAKTLARALEVRGGKRLREGGRAGQEGARSEI